MSNATKQYVLNEVAYVHHNAAGEVCIFLPREENVKFPGVNGDVILTILDIMCRPHTVGELSKELEKTRYSVDDVDFLVDELVSRNVLKEYSDPACLSTSLTPKQLAKYDRQLLNFAALPGNTIEDAVRQQERFSESSVLVIGVGGIGSYLSLGLAQIGIGTIHIVDFDEIELSNTSRQVLYREKDVGQLKTDVALRELQQVAPDATIVAHNCEVLSADTLNREFENVSLDLILVCADKPLGKLAHIVDEFSEATKTAILYGGPYANGKIFLGPLLLPGKTRSYSDLVPLQSISTSDNRIDRINNAHRVSAIVDTDNALAAKMMETEAIKYLGMLQEPSVVERQIAVDTTDWSVHSGQFAQ
ncbi:HesA/MoeB/ThiF family protein [Bifidobacterium coryneforme]|uniref:UBA/THIF-type NAD/FAD binding protein n=1 Tax=Bifidobacterium [indicum] DSM 20214 = LMG 11587 TaxID=1341694 RepID=A0A087VVN7_9BIFI|nr:ThiF family adenylyltransferase [Bifidobacterium indicum]AIC92570.1 UBA/THIF-type NAD/FAD binding protein [Bifidobacterium indicum LMG 11587 = DSM 20214]